MSDLQDAWRATSEDRSVGALADETRRHIVQTLRRRGGEVSEQDLAERLVAADGGSNAACDESGKVETLRLRLYHVHLPKLDDCGLVDWDRASRSVTATGHSTSGGRRRGDGPGGRDPLASAQVEDRRREVAAAVASAEGSVDREDLARKLAAGECAGQPSGATVDDAAVELHHTHLPKLDDAGVVEYDRDGGTVADGDVDYDTA